MSFLGLEGILSLPGFPIYTHIPNYIRTRKFLAHKAVRPRVLYWWQVTGWCFFFPSEQAVCSLHSVCGLLKGPNIPFLLFPPARCREGICWISKVAPHWDTRRGLCRKHLPSGLTKSCQDSCHPSWLASVPRSWIVPLGRVCVEGED